MDRLFNSLSETFETIVDFRPNLKVPNLNILGGGLVSIVRDRLKTQRRPKRDGLPLLLQSPRHPSITGEQAAEVEKVMEALRDFSADLLQLLNYVSGHLKFWQERNEATDTAKVKFMLLERGPWAFIVGVARLLEASIRAESVTKGINLLVSTRISSRVAVLTAVQCRLATLLGVVHMEVDRLDAGLSKGSNVRAAMASSLLAVFKAMSVLEGLYDLPQADSDSYDNPRAMSSISLQFEETPQELLRKSEWTDKDIELALEILSHNLDLLRHMVDCLMQHHKKPSKLARNWIRYTASTAAVAMASAWVIRHSRLVGSDDLDRWLREGNAALVSFTKEHVEQPLLAIRDELFETFRKRHNKADVVVEAQLTQESLRRMLQDYVKQTTGNVSEDLSQEELMKVMMTRYEDEVVHPLRNLLVGQLARALLIQVQKLKLDTERAMVELNQILRANEINFAMLAAFPAVLLTLFVGFIIQKLITEEGKKAVQGRDAQAARRMLMAEVEKAILRFQLSIDEDREDEAPWRFGMVIYALDMLYRSVEQAARATHEWSSLRGDIMDLATPRLATSYKLAITARMERIYECLVPLPTCK
ncbi:unnamed protein product [Calypogeia fissa]